MLCPRRNGSLRSSGGGRAAAEGRQPACETLRFCQHKSYQLVLWCVLVVQGGQEEITRQYWCCGKTYKEQPTGRIPFRPQPARGA
jgi:hypothetical protein